MVKVNIQVEEEHWELEVAEGANLLLEAAARSVPIPFRCTTGRCGTCRVQVTAGADQCSDYTELELFHMDGADLASGDRLACQTFVYGDVSIKVP
ncbi:2Fe-2S iron-sulfur cluster-binding protein [Laceyella putida]|uniref:2Fe-2S iron-sulfur cluster-binding protein n=1 Tax=Laceyella putida TaxID=110101 RepID=A0ABW2RHY1_9BACL